MLIGTTTDDDPAAALRAANVPGEVRLVADATAARLSPALNGGAVYTDDSAPVEWLVDLSLADVARTGNR
jgi:hypothetical protein